MDFIYDDIGDALTGDSTLDSLTAAVTHFRQPQEPKRLEGGLPVVVYTARDSLDEVGLHGAAVNVSVEVSVWGYKPNMYHDCLEAAQRVSELFLKGITLTGGGSTRWGEFEGWQQIDQPNPDTILLRATFVTRYWSSGRVAALNE